MAAAQPVRITSRGNTLVARARKLAGDAGAYRKLGQVLLEGEHLCAAWAASGQGAAVQALVGEAGWNVPALRQLAASAASIAIVDDGVMQSLSALDSAPSLLFIVDAPPRVPILPGVASVVLDRVQDPGNVGTILRSAAAFAFTQIIALEGTAALWSPKVVRAGMGAHFLLRLIEGADAAQLDALGVPLYGTSSHAEASMDAVTLASPCAWALGHEGGGLSPAVAGRCVRMLRIPHAGGQESLNVAAAAAICFYESAGARDATRELRGE